MRHAGVAIELLSVIALVASGSRAAVIAALASAILHTVYLHTSGRGDHPPLRWLMMRVSILIGACCISGVERFAPSYIATDISISNRWRLYEAGVRMALARPLSGWEEHALGWHILQWFAPDGTRAANHVVSGMLNCAIEYGSIPSATIVGVIWLCIWQNLLRPISPYRACAIQATVCVLICNIFSDLRSYALLTVLGAVSAGYLSIPIILATPARSVRVGTAAVLAIVALVLAASYVSVNLPVAGMYVSDRDGWLQVGARPNSGVSHVIVPDDLVSGHTIAPGLRAQLLTASDLAILVPLRSSIWPDSLPKAGHYVLIGRGAHLWDEDRAFTCLLNPIGDPPGNSRFVGRIIVPFIDQYGELDKWVRWGSDRGIPVTVARGGYAASHIPLGVD